MPRYDAKRIEPKWQAYWEQHETFKLPDEVPTGDAAKRGKLYVLDMFPYPSGEGLHVGHPEGYTATDIVSRYQRMRGKHVLHPMGWDAFGLPAEQHAIKTGTPPRETTYKNIANFRRQLKMLGFSYDWSREFSTTDPDYFRWTQWIFLELFDTWYDRDFEWTGPDGKKRRGRGRPISELPIPAEIKKAGERAVREYQDGHRLAYQHNAPVNWCPALGTVLANEEIIDGKSERGGHPVVRMPLRQWMLRITEYADRLIEDLDEVDWPESVKLLQRNWIGKSEGAEVDFFIGSKDTPADQLPAAFEDWKSNRKNIRLPQRAGRRGAAGLHDPAGYFVRGDLHGDGSRTSLCGSPHHARSKSRRPGLPRKSRDKKRPRPHRSWRRKKPASSPGPMRSTRSTASRFRFGSPITSSSATAPVRSWPCPRTMNGILSSLRPLACKLGVSVLPQETPFHHTTHPTDQEKHLKIEKNSISQFSMEKNLLPTKEKRQIRECIMV